MQLQLLYVVWGKVPRWCQNLPGLVPRDPGPPLTRKSSHWLKGGEWALLIATPNPAAQQIMVLVT